MGLFTRKASFQRTQAQAQAPAPGSSAHIAAASAFLRTAPTQGSISASAAAAALRSQTSSPEPIANIQTKRMIRKASMNSLRSNDRPSAENPRLMRRNSSSSMSERTFRSPSPGLATAPHHTSHRPRGVPADRDAPPVPTIPTVPAQLKQTTTRTRAASLGPPQRVTSPGPTKAGRNMSVDRGIGSRAAGPPQTLQLDREDSIRSINYSRPIASPTSSQPATPTSPTAARVNVRPEAPKDESMPAATNGLPADSTRKKKKKVSAEGPKKPPTPSSSDPAPLKTPALVSGLNAKKSAPPTVNTDVEPPQRDVVKAASPAASPRSTSTRPTNTLVKQPSMVREEPEDEDAAERAPTQISTPKPSAKKKKRPVQATAPSPPSTIVTQTNATATSRTRKASLEVPSPGIRFDSKIVDASTGPRHEPSRSASPAKSALKNSPASSIRTSSPVAPSDSDAGSITARKRVSFESDRLGSPVASPRRSVSPIARVDNQSPVSMKDRPELPTFGSVKRGDRASEQRRATPTSPLSPLSQETSSEADETRQTASPKTAPTVEINGVTEKEGVAETVSETASEGLSPGGQVPDISVQPATPGIVESGQTDPVGDLLSESAPIDRSTADNSAESPPLESIQSAMSESAVGDARPLSKRLSTASEASDTGDEFSDAAESPDDIEGGVFASLDAIVESPVRKPKSTPSSVGQMNETPTTPQDWKAMTAYWKSLTKAQREKLERQAAAEEDKDVSDADTVRPTPEQKPEETVADVATDAAAAGSPKRKTKKSKPASAAPAVQPATAAKKTLDPASPPTTSVPSASRASTGNKKTPRPIVQTEPKKSALKKTMRETSPEPAQARMKSSLRSSSAMGQRSLRDHNPPSERSASATGMRMSLRDGTGSSRPAGVQSTLLSAGTLRPTKQRPMSESFSAAPSRGPGAASGSQKRSSVQPALASQTLRTKDDSDSESSFRRKRRSSAGHNMRLSLRDGPGTASRGASPPARSSWSVRSLSPVGANPRPAFRSSMRASSVDPGPTMRGKHSRAKARDSKSPSRFSISLSLGSGPTSAGRRGSRFADSDSDDESIPGLALRSRILDSSDDEPMAASPEVASPATMRSARSLPAKKGRIGSMLFRNKDDSDSDAQSSISRRPSMVSLRGNRDKSKREQRSKAPLPNETEIKNAMEAAQRNVNAMLGKPQTDLPKIAEPVGPTAGGSKPGEVRVDTRIPSTDRTLAPADAGLVSPTPTMTRRTSMLGGLFRGKRTESMTEVPRIALQGGSPSTPTAEVPQQEFPVSASSPGTPVSAKSKRKLQRRAAPPLQRLDSSRLGAPQAGGGAPESAVLSTATSGGSAMRHWPLPKLPFTHARANSLDAAQPLPPKKPPTERTLSLMVPSGGGVEAEPPRPIPVGQPMTAIDGGDRKKRFGKLRKVFGRSG